MSIILKTVFGSHLYGLNSPSSDTDYKGIYLPTKDQILLSTTPAIVDYSTNKSHEKNTKDDVDFTIYSLKKFVQLACDGDIAALDMLHSKENLQGDSFIWQYIKKYRTKFYRKNMSSYMGFIKAHISEYKVKTDIISELEKLIKLLSECDLNTKIKEVELPIGVYCFYCTRFNKHINTNEQFYCINSKLININCKLRDVWYSVNHQHKKYSERMKQSDVTGNIDWKPLSHVLRLSYETEGEPQADMCSEV